MDESECIRLVETYSNMIYKIALNYLNNRDDAEDIVQEVFIRYSKNKVKFNDIEHEKSWFIRVTLNLCCNEVRSSRKRKQVLIENEEIISTESHYFENNNEIYECINKLPEKYKKVFELFYLDEYKTAEISKILKIKEDAVRTRLKRAREKLRELYKGE